MHPGTRRLADDQQPRRRTGRDHGTAAERQMGLAGSAGAGLVKKVFEGVGHGAAYYRRATSLLVASRNFSRSIMPALMASLSMRFCTFSKALTSI